MWYLIASPKGIVHMWFFKGLPILKCRPLNMFLIFFKKENKTWREMCYGPTQLTTEQKGAILTFKMSAFIDGSVPWLGNKIALKEIKYSYFNSNYGLVFY